MKEVKNKINVEEMIIQQINQNLEIKDRIESKAVGYLAVITLILTMLGQFMEYIKSAQICILFKNTSIGFCVLLFLYGAGLLIFCISIIFPKRVSYFNVDELAEFRKKNPDGNDDELIENARRFTNENRDIVNNISRKNLTVARGLAILVVGFIFTSVLFFITIGAAE